MITAKVVTGAYNHTRLASTTSRARCPTVRESQEPQIAQALACPSERRLHRTRPPPKAGDGPVLVDDRAGHHVAGGLLGRYPRGTEPKTQDLGHLEEAPRRAVGDGQEPLAGGLGGGHGAE